MKFKSVYKLVALNGLLTLAAACSGGSEKEIVTVDENGKEIKREVVAGKGITQDTMIVLGNASSDSYMGRLYLMDKYGSQFKIRYYTDANVTIGGAIQGNVVIATKEKGEVVDIPRNLTQEKIANDFVSGKLR